jgi:hypothetical protein
VRETGELDEWSTAPVNAAIAVIAAERAQEADSVEVVDGRLQLFLDLVGPA